jgi:hypothetical protein
MRHLNLFALPLMFAMVACAPVSTPSSVAPKGPSDKPLEPCHPGCFPAGTVIATPEGQRLIETIQPGDMVTLIGGDGQPTSGPVESTFQTCNRLVEVRTDSGNLLTTATQPLCLGGGGFRRADDLAEGDTIYRWDQGTRRPATVRTVVPTGQETTVYNLVVGESNVFVAAGFLARGKPPLVK